MLNEYCQLSLSDSFRGTRPFSGWLTKRIEERALRFVSSSFHLRYPRSSVRPLTTSASLQKRKIAVNARRGKGVNPAHGSLDFCPASYRSVPSISVERESLTPIEAFLLRCFARSYVFTCDKKTRVTGTRIFRSWNRKLPDDQPENWIQLRKCVFFRS